MKYILLVFILCSSSFGRNVGGKVPIEVQRIYKKGLNYLIECQNANGSWTNSSYGDRVTAFCVMVLLSQGDNFRKGKVADSLKKALKYLLNNQNTNGQFYKDNNWNYSLYDQGFITLALTEAYGMIDYPKLGEAIQKSIDLILKSQRQNPHKSWQYSVNGHTADTTVGGACLMALYGARNAGFNVPKDAIEKALKWQKSCVRNDGGSGYRSSGDREGNMTRTAITYLVLCLGNQKETEEAKKSLEFLKSRKNPMRKDVDHRFYEIYYVSQALFQGDIEDWKKWNKENLRAMGKQGDNGSWNNDSYHTSFNLLSMALYFRYLPIYEKY